MTKSIVSTTIKAIIIAALCAVIVLTTVLCLTGQNGYLGLKDHSKGALYEINYYEAKSDKAMLLIPGLMASTLYDLETDKPVWGYDGILGMVTDLIKIQSSNATTAEKEKFAQALIDRLACDENNVPVVRERVGTMEDPDAYGSFQGMKYIYDILTPLYGKQYDIIVWQYDWRQSNTGSALELEKFINYHGYKEVMFFTHSMGGVVVSNYLARSEANRTKTKLFMPFGCPLLGSMDAVNNLFESDGSGMIASALTMVKDMFNTEFSINMLARSMASVYELLPFPAYDTTRYFNAQSADYVGRQAGVYFESKPVKNEELITVMSSYAWAKRANGSLKPAVENLGNYFDSLYIDVDGQKVFVTDLVPTEYIVGVGLNTLVSAGVDKEGKIVGKVYSTLGDGTVPAYSATAGHPLDAENVHLVYGIAHGPLANGRDVEGHTPETTGLKYVPGIMAKYIEKTDSELEA